MPSSSPSPASSPALFPVISAIDLTLASKLGAMAATYASEDTCPDACALKRDPRDPSKPGPCFAKHGRVGLHWRRLSAPQNAGRYLSPADFLSWLRSRPIASKIRDRIAGDQIPLPHSYDLIDQVVLGRVSAIVRRRKLRMFTYTHYLIELAHNASAIRAALANGFAINASCDTFEQAAERSRTHPDIPRVVVAPHDYSTKDTTIAGERFVMCPNAWNKRITCDICMLCADPHRTGYTIVFPAHGSKKKAVDLIPSLTIAA